VCPPKAGKDKHSMSKRTANNLFILPSIPRLYKQLLTGVASYEALGRRIIERIKLAHAFRQVEQVRELANILISIPIKEHQLIAQYYLVWCKGRNREYDTEILEKIIDQTSVYKVKALLSKAAFEGYQDNTTSELYFFNEALKHAPTISESIEISKAIAVIKAKERFHRSAVRDLENLIPIIKYAEPLACCDVLNSYAVELGEVGRLHEARNVSRIVIASPFAPAYPEWRETAEDLKPANRSVVAKGRLRYRRQNILPMPVVGHGATEQVSYNAPAIVFNLQQWKDKMAKGKKKKDDNSEKTPENLTERDIIFRIIVMYTSPETTPAQRFKIWDSVQKIIATPDDPKLDDDESDGA
jgi:hypothetical protein